jgi:hypothetical protein
MAKIWQKNMILDFNCPPQTMLSNKIILFNIQKHRTSSNIT